ncbi:universal stress protein family protein [Desulfosporosinus acididurans]|uniref:Universal stress protein family protein n=1 Tax=Desulfosporosinus acididurans TaxID=476652 RepID=A0A0J1FML3_9FIRM|nr:universal stress protein [Desulfosporosinus acididurans]KLU64715.1 universal stress protein family protein [Desulfosporosinus acididurans]
MENKLKVLLYSDGSYQALSAAVYAANLLQNSPQMNLTILRIQEKDGGSLGVKYSWKELRVKCIKYYWSNSSGAEFNWLDGWPVSPDQKWLKKILDGADHKNTKKYEKLLSQTNNIFLQRKQDVQHQILYLNTCFSEKSNRSEIVKALADYAEKNAFQLIIIGTRGFSKFRRTIVGSFSQEILAKSKVPALLIKKLSAEFICSFLSDS